MRYSVLVLCPAAALFTGAAMQRLSALFAEYCWFFEELKLSTGIAFLFYIRFLTLIFVLIKVISTFMALFSKKRMMTLIH
ncbi:hypothetical protein [Geofilum rhodophaeum]|uniref:hypothetical protein n=1 Tax=Geofilum rhodophaeum TaxID=1965019 RepID=UPI0011BAAF45|nr:hypothetical protein [Geofilum rhodophaeum]